jgi:hypothetical protein
LAEKAESRAGESSNKIFRNFFRRKVKSWKNILKGQILTTDRSEFDDSKESEKTQKKISEPPSKSDSKIVFKPKRSEQLRTESRLS